LKWKSAQMSAAAAATLLLPSSALTTNSTIILCCSREKKIMCQILSLEGRRQMRQRAYSYSPFVLSCSQPDARAFQNCSAWSNYTKDTIEDQDMAWRQWEEYCKSIKIKSDF
jgi:hypothetical protein